MWATFEGEKIRATPDAEGYCSGCNAKLIPRCGMHKQWHWAHLPEKCDPWYEPETRWHINWKNLFPIEQREVLMGNHRADVKGKNYVVELQHSPISTDEIREREAFYQRMIWIFDLREVFKKGHLSLWEQDFSQDRSLVKHKDWKIFKLSWSWQRKTILSCQAPVLLHLEKGLLINIFNLRYGGHARQVSQSEFMTEVNGNSVELFKSIDFTPAYYTRKELYEMRGFA